VAFLAWNPDPITVAPLPEAFAGARRALRPLLPHAAIVLALLALYRLLLGLRFDEHSAAFILPAMLLVMLAWDKRGAQAPGLAGALGLATRRCSTQVGALLMMMSGSVGLGGVAERSEVVLRLPHDLGSPFVAISVIMVVLVLIGMAMDELGSVVLVSVTLLPIALENGIAPVHFWMVVLVGFELGYLAPPVALNQLLTRQVVGREAQVELLEPRAGLSAYSHVLVPVAILGSALVLVAYGPLLWGQISAGQRGSCW
jgi:TRAP-type mannitol/chloroaromatic compound transport system permease large subunit